MTGDDRHVEDLGDHQFLVTLTVGDDTVEMQVHVDPAVVENAGLAAADDQKILHATIDFLLARQQADDLPSQIALDEVAAAYGDFLDDVRERVASNTPSA